MTGCTPAQARELAAKMEDSCITGNSSVGQALRSLADQLEQALSHPKSIEADSGVIAAPVVFATVLDPRDLRVFLQSLQAGEMSVSRAVEILDMWLVGKYSDDQVPPPPADSALIVDDKFPMELVRELRAELADLRAAAPVVPAPEARDEWRELFWSVARALNCLPSTYVDGNAHVYKQAEKYAAIATAAPVAQLSDPPEADMFWNNDDPERCADSIHEVLEREWQDGILQVGDIRTIQQAMKLPNVRVIVTSADGDEDGFDYDLIRCAANPAVQGRVKSADGKAVLVDWIGFNAASAAVRCTGE